MRLPKRDARGYGGARVDDLKGQVLEQLGPEAILSLIAEAAGQTPKRFGGEYVVDCPDADHSKPKYAINPRKGQAGVMGCFACGTDGEDLFAAIQRFQTMPSGRAGFRQALEWVADRLGIEHQRRAANAKISDEEREAQRQERERKRIEREKAEAEEREKARKNAFDIWAEAEADSDGARVYLTGRGLDATRLPGSIRYHPKCPDFVGHGDQMESYSGPAVLFGAVGADGRFRAYQAVYLSDDGVAKRPEDPQRWGPAKKTRARVAGAAVRFNGDVCTDVLVLTEGPETALAVCQATGLTTWACLSTSGLKNVKLPTSLVPDEWGGCGGVVRRVIIAGDHDRAATKGRLKGTRPGERAAYEAARRLLKLHKGLKVLVALPPPRDGADQPRDWLDVLNEDGPGAVEDGIDRGVTVDPEVRDQEDDDGKRIMPELDGERARLYLDDVWSGDGGRKGRAGECYRLVCAQGKWWRYTGNSYTEVAEGSIRGSVRRWAESGFNIRKLKSGGKGNAPQTSEVAFIPSKRAIEAVVEAVRDEVLVDTDEVRFWIAPRFDETGVPFDHTPAWTRIGGDDDPPPQSVIAFQNGLLHLEPWMSDRRVELRPHTGRFFNKTLLGLDLPVKELRGPGDIADREPIYERLCPTWWKFLWEVSCNDLAWMMTLQQWFGYALTTDISYESANILVLHGPGRAGKGTVRDALINCIGTRNYVSSRFDKLTDGPHLASWMHKLLAIFPDAAVGRYADGKLAVEILKAITGGDEVSIRELYRSEMPAVRLFTRVLILCNTMPDLTDATNALAARMLVLDFKQSFADKADPEVKRKINRETAGIMVWALDGLPMLRRNGGFEQPEGSREPLDVFTGHADPLEEWMQDVISFDYENEGACFTIDQVHRAYVGECKGSERYAPKKTTFARCLLPLLRKHGWKGARVQRMVDGRRQWVYTGAWFEAPSPAPPYDKTIV